MGCVGLAQDLSITVVYFQMLFNLNSCTISDANLIFHVLSAPHVDGPITNLSSGFSLCLSHHLFLLSIHLSH